MMDRVPKMKIVSVKFSHAMFTHLDFLNPEDGTDRLSRNVGNEFANQRCIISRNSADLTWRFGAAGLGLTLHGPVRVIQLDTVWFSASYANFRW